MYAAVTYVTNYTTKSDLHMHDLLDLTRVAVDKWKKKDDADEVAGVNKTVDQRTRSLVLTCFHGITGHCNNNCLVNK
jgi:hypothetical protein